jgi:hypothetical protein
MILAEHDLDLDIAVVVARTRQVAGREAEMGRSFMASGAG